MTWAIILIALGAWIFLVVVVRKKKTKIFHDQMESELAERRYKRLKTFLRIAGISLVVAIVGVILHGVLGILLEIEEEVVSFFIAVVALWVFAVATIAGLVILLIGRRKTT